MHVNNSLISSKNVKEHKNLILTATGFLICFICFVLIFAKLSGVSTEEELKKMRRSKNVTTGMLADKF